MIAINKSEKDAITARFPHIHIARTMKQKSKRHHYYCEESNAVMKFIAELRGEYKERDFDGRNLSKRKKSDRR